MLGIGLHWHVMTIAWQPAIFMMIGTACGAVLAPFIMDKLGGNRKEAFSKFMKPLIALILLFMGIKRCYKTKKRRFLKSPLFLFISNLIT